MEKIRGKRISEELNSLKRAQLTKKLPSNINFELQLQNGVLDDYKLEVTFTGRISTIWENYKIKGILSFPNNYPIEAPKFQFINSFQHIHVYPNGVICLPLITQEYWDTKTTLLNILIQIEELIHRPPNLASPANHELSQLYSKDKQEYEEFIKQKQSNNSTSQS